ncbi:hypothetical protein C8R45DRAFT_1107071 [Mycena sanguinolenta]|nr:hypothetical protein C8R45DRAFT_1107071 [Mycena sanguinolenta]
MPRKNTSFPNLSDWWQVRQGHNTHLDKWLCNNIHTFPKDLDTDNPDGDEVLCEVVMRLKKAVPDDTIFEGPDLYHLFLSISTSDSAHVPCSFNSSPYRMLGHWFGSHDDGDAPLWTRNMTDGVRYKFRQPRTFMARFVAGLTDIWVGDLLHQTISPRMLEWAVANARGTPVAKEVLRQRTRIIAQLFLEQHPFCPPRWIRGTNLRRGGRITIPSSDANHRTTRSVYWTRGNVTGWVTFQRMNTTNARLVFDDCLAAALTELKAHHCGSASQALERHLVHSYMACLFYTRENVTSTSEKCLRSSCLKTSSPLRSPTSKLIMVAALVEPLPQRMWSFTLHAPECNVKPRKFYAFRMNVTDTTTTGGIIASGLLPFLDHTNNIWRSSGSITSSRSCYYFIYSVKAYFFILVSRQMAPFTVPCNCSQCHGALVSRTTKRSHEDSDRRRVSQQAYQTSTSTTHPAPTLPVASAILPIRTPLQLPPQTLPLSSATPARAPTAVASESVASQPEVLTSPIVDPDFSFMLPIDPLAPASMPPETHVPLHPAAESASVSVPDITVMPAPPVVLPARVARMPVAAQAQELASMAAAERRGLQAMRAARAEAVPLVPIADDDWEDHHDQDEERDLQEGPQPIEDDIYRVPSRPATRLPAPNDLHSHPAAYMLYLLVVWLHTALHLPFRGCDVVLQVVAYTSGNLGKSYLMLCG